MLAYPDFYVESSPSLFHGHSLPNFGHAIWSLPNVHPEINGTVGQGQHDGWAFSVSGLASGIIRTYNGWKANLDASGHGLTKYSFRIVGIGNGNASGVNANSIYLMNDQRDMIGATGAGFYFQDHLVPWAGTGIANMLNWGTGFWPLLRSYFTIHNLPMPELMIISTENTADDTRGLVYQGTGWVDRALADPRSNDLWAGTNQTFTEYWNNTTGYLDGTLIPTGLVLDGSWQYIPENEKLRQKWQGAYKTAHSYATLKGIMEPFWAQFGNLPVGEYQFFAANRNSPVNGLYPGQPLYLYDPLHHTMQAPDWYSTYPAFHSEAEDGIPPYWDSDFGWITTYPKPETYKGSLDASGYAKLAYGMDTITNCIAAAPNKPLIPYISLQGNSNNIPMMIEFLQFCILEGVNKFYVFEGDTLIGDTYADMWYNVIRDINIYVDSLNSNRSYNVSTVVKVGGVFYKY